MKMFETVNFEAMQARYEPSFLEKLMAIWPHPKTSEPGITTYVLSKETGISQQALHYLFELNAEGQPKRWPSWDTLNKLGGYFQIVQFITDPNKTIDNDAVLKCVAAFLEAHAYKKTAA